MEFITKSIMLLMVCNLPEVSDAIVNRHHRALDNHLVRSVYPLLLTVVRQGGQRGIKECQHLFKNEIWNCVLENKKAIEKLPIFVKTTLKSATRETAFVHAISSAAITHEITNECRMDRIPGCQCSKVNEKASGQTRRDWQWGGCSDNVKYGYRETKRFIDNLERGNGDRTAFNLHNNEVGRKVVRENLMRECKCHGVSGTCQLQTCWKQLAPFKVVGAELKRKYLTAVQVLFREGKLHEKAKAGFKPVSQKDKKLVYLQASPDYCVTNVTAGSKGMLGRQCSSDDMTTKECKSLCSSCNLQHQTIVHYRKEKCRCQFVWCCSIKCDICTKKYSVTTCRGR